MSTTIRVSLEDKERLARFAKKVNASSLAEAFRIALSMAEEKLEEFRGDVEALNELLKHAKAVGGDASEHVDEELARILQAESM
ncbi:MAG TPA: hypothetical protein ENF34_01500 [Candidatus Bathyarchaeota archaeon]|nr:hypothetical protein [Candidatus Bathyarchaeota archaeon]